MLAGDNFKFDERGRKLVKRAENTVGKGEIARYEQFLLSLQCFQKTCTADTLKPGLVWERLKEERAAYPHFLIVTECFQKSTRAGSGCLRVRAEFAPECFIDFSVIVRADLCIGSERITPFC